MKILWLQILNSKDVSFHFHSTKIVTHENKAIISTSSSSKGFLRSLKFRSLGTNEYFKFGGNLSFRYSKFTKVFCTWPECSKQQ